MTHLQQAAAQYAETFKAHQQAVAQRRTFVSEFKKKHRIMYVSEADFQEHGLLEMKRELTKRVHTLKKEVEAQEKALQSAARKFAEYA